MMNRKVSALKYDGKAGARSVDLLRYIVCMRPKRISDMTISYVDAWCENVISYLCFVKDYLLLTATKLTAHLPDIVGILWASKYNWLV